MSEAFVYRWTDFSTNKLYVGSHKGTPEDGYVCSSKLMLQEYKNRPQDFSREILAFGTHSDMYAFETAILKAAGADKDPGYYNQTLNQGKFYLKRHTEKTKRLMSMNASTKNNFAGKCHTTEVKEKLRQNSIGNQHAKGITYSHTPEQKTKRSERMMGQRIALGSSHSCEANRKQSERQLGVKHFRVTCPHCQRAGGARGMVRYHFHNCKKKVV